MTHIVSDGRPTDGARTSAESRTQTKTETETPKTPSSRSVALAGRYPDSPDMDRLSALAAVVLSIRPDWRYDDTRSALLVDDRPWRTVVVAAVNGAADPGIRHPNGLRYVNAGFGDTAPPRLPSVAEALALELCPTHAAAGFRAGACPICRIDAANRRTT